MTFIARLYELAEDAIEALESEEAMTESEFGIGAKGENYYEKSQALQQRLDQLRSEITAASEVPAAR